MLLSLENASFKYNTEPILDHVNFVVNDRDKWGVVGRNGAGKSTFLAVMAQKQKLDTGEITAKKDLVISYCPQASEFPSGRTIFQTVQDALKEKVEDYQIQSILNKLGLTDYDAMTDVLSGGQKKRLALAIALIRKADLYLLDEPTNHLDQQMILWLEKYLMKSDKAVVLVTHDRYFLARITNHIVEVDRGHLYCYTGDYADYLEQREIRREQAEASRAKRENYLRHEIAWIRAGAQARSTKQKSRIQRYEKIAAIKDPAQEQTLQLQAGVTRLGGNTILLEDVSKAYGDHVLFCHFSYEVQHHDRIGIIGPNGCGKSTLLKVIVGQIKPDTGTVRIGETVKIGYFAQHNEVFKEDERVMDYLESFGHTITTADHETITASQMLERFLFPKEKQYQPIKKCSGGEKRRLYLCSILMQSPNILILDEPTNDLDTDTLTILESFLQDFPGAVLAVSHDRYFLDRIAERLFVFNNGTIEIHQESYSDYLDAQAAEKSEEKEKNKEVRKVSAPKPSNRLSYMEKKELEKLEKEIPGAEQNVRDLEAQLNNATDYPEIQKISADLETARSQMDEMEERWMELSEKAEN